MVPKPVLFIAVSSIKQTHTADWRGRISVSTVEGIPACYKGHSEHHNCYLGTVGSVLREIKFLLLWELSLDPTRQKFAGTKLRP
jgi:hypothetical protein